MTIFQQGTKWRLTPKPNGAVYSPWTYTVDKPDQVGIAPATDGSYCDFSPVVDNTAEDFTITYRARNDPNDTTKMLVVTFTGTDALKSATAAPADISSVP